MELIAPGHGDNDFFMDPSQSQMAQASCGSFFEKGRNGCKGEHYVEQGAFAEYVNASAFMTRSTCQRRFQMTHFVFTQCKFATASLDLVD